MEIILVCCVVVIGILLFLTVQLRNELTSLYQQLRYTREENSTFTIFTNSNNQRVKQIAKEINAIKNMMLDEKHHHIKNEKDVQDMIANISHDIRTPLTSIQGYLEMMQSSNDANERERYYEIIRHRLDDLEGMLDEFFIYTKLMSSKEEFDLEPMEVYPMVCRCLLSYRDLLKDHQLEPNIICEDETIAANLHEESFKRLCTNLIINTIRYGKKPFQVTIKQQENDVLLVFANGLDSMDMDVTHMFDRFYKGSEARTQKGSGLGLAIVKELSEHMHGSVSACKDENMLQITVRFPSI